MPNINIHLTLGDDRVIKSAAAASASSNEAVMRSTSKTLSALLLSSNTLRQKSEAAADALEAMPRTSAVAHALGVKWWGSWGSRGD